MKKKNLVDFVTDKGGTWSETILAPVTFYGESATFRDIEITLKVNDGNLEVYETGTFLKDVNDEETLQDYIETMYGAEIRFCDVCGGIMQSGYTDDYGDFYTHEECFEQDMNERYGEGNWREIDTCCGVFFEYLEDGNWLDEPSYYTEWF